MSTLHGKTYVVTGASTGIGRSTAILLANAGAQVFAGVRNQDAANMLEGESPNIRPLMLDVTNPDQIMQAAQTVSAAVQTRGLNGLINNAGMAVAAPLEFVPIDEFRYQIEVNLIGQVAVTQAFLPCLRAAKGRIINITSIGGRIAGRLLGAYHASKFAMEALTDTMRQELSPWGLQVVAIEPGEIATPIWITGTSYADRVMEKMPPQVTPMYGSDIEALRASAPSKAANGLPPEKVAAVIYRALTAARPKTRYLVGTDAQIGDKVFRLLPDRLRDYMIRRMM